MRHFTQLDRAERARLFHRLPQPFSRDADASTLAAALGATLYMPATRTTVSDDLVRQGARGVMSSVVCLEDAVADIDLASAQQNAIAQLRHYARRTSVKGGSGDDYGSPGPLVFVRVRRPEQIAEIVDELGDDAAVLSGFVMPKFTDLTGAAFLDALADARSRSGHRLFGMPVIESPEILYRETRTETLLGISALLAKHRDEVLAVRIGATDLCAAYGIRRTRDLTVYDVHLVAGAIADIVNVLGRADDSGFVVTGPVWEYFSDRERIFKPQLRQSPFDEHDARSLRRHLITADLDGLIREIVLDKANGLVGKTVIHPTHVAAVHALSVVTHEEFSDASDLLDGDMSAGGVKASGYRNKMNESRPHHAWAKGIHRRAAAFGVAAGDVSVVDLLAACVDA